MKRDAIWYFEASRFFCGMATSCMLVILAACLLGEPLVGVPFLIMFYWMANAASYFGDAFSEAFRKEISK